MEEKINVSTLRENLAEYIGKAQKGQSFTITSRGHELAMLTPAKNRKKHAAEQLKKLGKTAIIGDIISPIDANWKAAE